MNSPEQLELKAEVSVDDTGTITGIAWPFGSPDTVGDVIRKGAFRLPPALPIVMEHDQSRVVGVWETAAETDRGLEVKGRLFVEGIAPARQAYGLTRKGAVSGLSISFRDGRCSPLANGGREFTDLTVTEISLCRTPVHSGARITSVKSMNQGNEMDSEVIDVPPAVANELKAVNDSFTQFAARLDKIETKLARPGVSEAKSEAETGVVERKAFGSYLRLGNQTPVDELKALVVSSDPQAGYLAPAETSSEFIRDLIEFSPIRSYASVRTTGAPSVKYPRRTAITNAQWEGELEESEESEVAFGQLEVSTAQLKTFVDISNELLADSGGAAEAEVRLALAEDFGKKEATGFMLGSGVKQPEGLLTHAGIAHTVNGHATNLSADKLIDLLYALPAAYRNGSGAAWALNGTTLATVRKLKDGQGNYLWQPAYVAGQPETILGKPVIEMVDMDDVGDGKFPIIFGDFSAYRILDRLALSILSDPYTQARKGVTRIHATRRVGGRVLQAARFRKLKTSAA